MTPTGSTGAILHASAGEFLCSGPVRLTLAVYRLHDGVADSKLGFVGNEFAVFDRIPEWTNGAAVVIGVGVSLGLSVVLLDAKTSQTGEHKGF